MFGKHYESMYTGSMRGRGAVAFAVWGYVISHVKPPDYELELNPDVVAFLIGEPEESISAAIEQFCSPDPKSRTQEHEGRKLIKRGVYLYFVVNGKIYHDIRSEEDKKAFWREEKKKQRESQEMTKEMLSSTPAIREVFDSWNSTADKLQLKKCLVISDKRRRTLEARLRDGFFVENWRESLRSISTSKFCQGVNNRGWIASFDWFIQPDVVPKIMEGTYENREPQKPADPTDRNANNSNRHNIGQYDGVGRVNFPPATT